MQSLVGVVHPETLLTLFVEQVRSVSLDRHLDARGLGLVVHLKQLIGALLDVLLVIPSLEHLKVPQFHLISLLSLHNHGARVLSNDRDCLVMSSRLSVDGLPPQVLPEGHGVVRPSFDGVG